MNRMASLLRSHHLAFGPAVEGESNDIGPQNSAVVIDQVPAMWWPRLGVCGAAASMRSPSRWCSQSRQR